MGEDRREELPPHEGFDILPGGEFGFPLLVGPQYCKMVNGAPVIGMRAQAKHLNFFGGVHGGMLATIADLQGAAVRTIAGLGDVMTPTISLSVDFLAPVRAGAWIELHSELVKQTRTLLFCRAELRADDEIVARTNGIYKIGRVREASQLDLTPESFTSY